MVGNRISTDKRVNITASPNLFYEFRYLSLVHVSFALSTKLGKIIPEVGILTSQIVTLEMQKPAESGSGRISSAVAIYYYNRETFVKSYS